MSSEIDILTHAAGKGCAVVEKASHRLWESDDLAEAASAGRFREDDCLGAPADQVEISGPYPGCIQQSAAPAEGTRYRLVAQTRHFLIFSPPPNSGQEKKSPSINSALGNRNSPPGPPA